MKFSLQRVFWLGATLVYMLGILWFSTKPGAIPGSGHYSVAMENFKNFLHFPAYGGLAWLLFKSMNSIKIPSLIAVFVIATSWGILNEFVQAHTPHRYFSIDDMVVNAVGALLVIVLAGKKVIRVVE